MDRIDELIKKYRLQYLEDNDKFIVRESDLARKDKVLDELKALAPEIKARFRKIRAEERKMYEERQKRIAAIEGLDEIRKAQNDLALWHKEFSASFNGEYAVGGMGVRAKPEYDLKAMYEKYPVAAAYLKAKAQSEKSNYELSEIGKKALEEIINNPTDYKHILKQMEREIKEFTDHHMWD